MGPSSYSASETAKGANRFVVEIISTSTDTTNTLNKRWTDIISKSVNKICRFNIFEFSHNLELLGIEACAVDNQKMSMVLVDRNVNDMLLDALKNLVSYANAGAESTFEIIISQINHQHTDTMPRHILGQFKLLNAKLLKITVNNLEHNNSRGNDDIEYIVEFSYSACDIIPSIE